MKSDLAKDDWVKRSSPINAYKLHAIGAITTHWGECELMLADVVASIVKIDQMTARILCIEVGSVSLSSKIKLLMDHLMTPPEKRGAVQYALDFFELCRINRNRYAHAMPMTDVRKRGNSTFVTLGLLGARKRGDTTTKQITDTLEEIRSVAEEIKQLSDLLSAISVRSISEEADVWTSLSKPPLPRNRQNPASHTRVRR